MGMQNISEPCSRISSSVRRPKPAAAGSWRALSARSPWTDEIIAERKAPTATIERALPATRTALPYPSPSSPPEREFKISALLGTAKLKTCTPSGFKAPAIDRLLRLFH